MGVMAVRCGANARRILCDSVLVARLPRDSKGFSLVGVVPCFFTPVEGFPRYHVFILF